MIPSFEAGTRCWVKSKEQGWVGATVRSSKQSDDGRCEIELDPESGDEPLRLNLGTAELATEVQLRNPPVLEATSDLVTLSYQNEPSVLHAIRQRYAQMNIYTFSGIVLIATNPFAKMDSIYTNEAVQMYSGRQRGELEPHLFSIAEDAFRCMQRDAKNQTIVVSGESGAGKTVSAKYIMRYFATVENPLKKPASSVDTQVYGGLSRVEREILATNPIMEAFGNAKTTRNDNSSRFGKYLEIRFSDRFEISGARIRTYLLERSRLVFHPASERNYHIFYQLLNGLDVGTLRKLALTSVSDYKYLNQGAEQIDGVDDRQEFVKTREALAVVGVTGPQIEHVFSLLAALLHVGNIELKPTGRGVLVSTDDAALGKACELLGVEPSALAKWLAKKQLQMRSETILSDMDAGAATIVRDSLAKYLYASLFDWLVHTINAKLCPDESESGTRARFIGVLDIYGFEHFEQNSFEQFCINYANEKLQQEFNQHVFKLEQEEYAAEEIDWTYIDFVDNEPCIALIEGKMGILSLLDEESRLKQGSDDGFAQKLYSTLDTNPHFRKPRLGQSAFIVEHYAHDVAYETEGFIEKNRDTVPDTILAMLNESTNEFLLSVLASQTAAPATPAPPTPATPAATPAATPTRGLSGGPSRVPKRPTLGNMFKTSLGELMDTISSTNAHYIRCIKPNEEKQAWKFDGPLVLNQLRACGVLETIRISSKGFPGRWMYEEFADRYKLLVHSSKRAQPPRDLSLSILEEFAPESDRKTFALGKLKVFLRAGMLAHLENKRTKRQADAATEIQRFVKMRAARSAYDRLQRVLRGLQAAARAKLAQKQFAHMKTLDTAVRVQSLFRARKVRRHTAQTRAAVVLVQRLVRAAQAKQHALERAQTEAAVLMQSLVRAKLVRTEFLNTKLVLCTVQSMVRRTGAKKELEKLKTKETTDQYAQTQHYEMENKVVELQNALAIKRDEHRAATDELATLTAVLGTAQAALAELRVSHTSLQTERSTETSGLQQAIEQHRENAEQLQQQLSERIAETETLQTALSAATEKVAGMEKLVQELELENKQLRMDMDAMATAPTLGSLNTYRRRAVKSVNPDDEDSREKRFRELVMEYSAEMERSEEARLANGTLEHTLRDINAIRNELIDGLVRNLVIPTRSQDGQPIPKCDVLFAGNVINVLISELWRFGLLSQSEKLLGSFFRVVQESVSKKPVDYTIKAVPFWISNLMQLYSFIALVERNLQTQTNSSMPDSEVEQYTSLTDIALNDVSTTIFNLYFLYIREIKKHISKWIVPAVVEEQSIPGFKTETPKRMLGLFSAGSSAKTEAKEMDNLILFLNRVHASLTSYYLEEQYVHMALMETMTLIAVRSFNDMIMRQNFLSWKRGVQINYNVTRLDEWCKGHNFPQGGQPLEPITQASKLLQLKKNYEEDASVIYDICWNLSPAQINKFISNYEIEDYESPISPKVTEYLKERMREDKHASTELLFPLRSIFDAGPFEMQPPRALEKLEPYMPDSIQLPIVRNLLQLTTQCFSIAENARAEAEERARLEVYPETEAKEDGEGEGEGEDASAPVTPLPVEAVHTKVQ